MANWLKEQFRNFVTLCISLIFCAINLFLKKVYKLETGEKRLRSEKWLNVNE